MLASSLLAVSCAATTTSPTAASTLAPSPKVTISSTAAPVTSSASGASADTTVALWTPNQAFYPEGNKLAEIPERQIALYSGEQDGVRLVVGNTWRTFNWNYMTPREILPQMHIADFDGDGTDELMVILSMGSGTGVSVYELHIVDIYQKPQGAGALLEIRKAEAFRDSCFKAEDYKAQLDQAVRFTTYTKDKELRADVDIADAKSSLSLAEFQENDYGKVNEQPVFGTVVGFSTEKNRLKAEFGLGLTAERLPWPNYVGKVLADVDYGDGQFTLANLRFEPEAEYVLPQAAR